ncbi:hypothetical protein [Streptomyces sp. NBC_01465]|uniref:hypothetical protein n=1 Tax=Streptomyces sp. NBC_01465 TaxID=2903878 RepID=UPI002E2F8FA8|nr:hypothetical protein [Streptomyces sp. NBC_01465]
MSAPEERSPLTPRPSLYEHALRLLQEEPNGGRPQRGYPLPEKPASRPDLRWPEAKAAVQEIVGPLLTSPDLDPDPARAADELHRRLDPLGVQARSVRNVVVALPLSDEVAARALARHLTRTGTSAPAVAVGLALLDRLGGPEDIPYLDTLSRFRDLTRPALQALSAVDRPAAGLAWLRQYTRTESLRPLIDALTARDAPAIRDWLLAHPLDPRTVGPEPACRIAEAVRLTDLLRAEPVDPRLLSQAVRLLARMTSPHDYRVKILDYTDAVTAYTTVVAHLSQLPPSLDDFANLLSLAVDLHSGPSTLLDWEPGRREALLDTLNSVPSTPAWSAVAEAVPADPADSATLRRQHWIRRTAHQPLRSPTPGGPTLRIEVAVSDPIDPSAVETRILIDGRPLVAEFFGLGPAGSPERLLDNGSLRATAEPHEVQLAEAYCTEGCCGALYVTIRRDGDDVVWSDWRLSNTPASRHRTPPTHRFDATAYDTEITRAERDDSWSWPARTTARLISAGLRARPDLLTRWDAQRGWTGTDFADPDSVAVSFTYWPGLSADQKDKDGPWLQFVWTVPDDDTPPETRAAAALDRLATTDPKTYADVRGGSREYAAALGYPWPER